MESATLPRALDGTQERAAIWRELHERALRHSLWLSILHAQEIGEITLQGQLTSMLVLVDAIREDREEAPHSRKGARW